MTTNPAPAGDRPTDSPGPAAADTRLPTGVRVFLFVVLPIIVVLALVGAGTAFFTLFRGTAFSDDLSADAGSRVTVTVPNARMSFVPSGDDRVRVEVRGSYAGAEPRVTLRTSGDETTVTGGCVRGWFPRCTLAIRVSLPADADLSVTGTNGRITATDLDGFLDLRSTNGAIRVDDATGDLRLVTSNGGIDVREASALEVSVRTTNGPVDLQFVDPPTAVEARSTNGGITIRVPDDDTDYFVETRTTNGSTDTADVPSDRRADRTILAETTNGRVTVQRADE